MLIWFLASRPFIWYPTRLISNEFLKICKFSHGNYECGFLVGPWFPKCIINAFLWFLASIPFIWYPTCLVLGDFERIQKNSHAKYGRGPVMTFLHIGWCDKIFWWLWGPIWAPWKWNCFFWELVPWIDFFMHYFPGLEVSQTSRPFDFRVSNSTTGQNIWVTRLHSSCSKNFAIFGNVPNWHPNGTQSTRNLAAVLLLSISNYCDHFQTPTVQIGENHMSRVITWQSRDR